MSAENYTADDFIRPSSMEAGAICAGYAQMSAAVANTWGEPPPDEVADSGNDLHGAVASEIRGEDPEPAPATKWEQYMVNLCLELVDGLIAEYDIQPEDVHVEKRLPGADLGMKKGGTADVILVVRKNGKAVKVIVIDWKFGFIDQGDADGHEQLLVYALMSAQLFGVDEADIILFMPRMKANLRLTSATYKGQALIDGAEWVRSVTAAQRAPNPELTPSFLACQHCRGLIRCIAAKEYIMRLSEAAKSIGKATDPKTAGEQIGAVLLAGKLHNAGKEVAKEFLRGGGVASGFTLTEGGMTTKIDAPKAIELAREAGKLDDLLDHVGVKASAIEALEGIIDGACTYEPKAGSIKPDKNKLKEAV